ncbi:MAG: hypothetical protein A3D94_19795 [Alphaproteobacteria bacterium RIFCSPHIGHO2_12_FULL_66_14]|nr:MAG: hypothetical protein A3D94_19795 [Alphaproteobacteria bacterium RIFCSPHIGHO2_12_FULL_66_14]
MSGESFVPPISPLVLNLAVALGIGLLIGIDRERRKGDGPGRAPAGIRTFTITSLCGAVAVIVGGDLLLAVVTAGVFAMASLAYWRASNQDPGLSTEAALVATALLGGLAVHEPALAAGLGVIVAGLLTARTAIHRFVRSALTEEEVRDGLIFAGATLVVLPLLPDKAFGPYGALNPRTIWIVVVLVMGVSALGYIAVRLMGARFGLPLAGLASGFISSVATIGAMGARAAKNGNLLRPAVAAAVLSTVATFVQLTVLLAATSTATLMALSVPLACGGAAALLYGGVFTVLALRHEVERQDEPGHAFSLRSALLFAALLAVILVASAALDDWFGGAGVLAVAGLAGLADTHSPAISVASLVASDKLGADAAVVPILAAVTTNTLTKMVFAVTGGGAAFAVRVIPGLILVLAAAWAGARFFG